MQYADLNLPASRPHFLHFLEKRRDTVGLWIMVFIIISNMYLKCMIEGFLLDPTTQNPRMWGKRNEECDSFSRSTGDLIKVRKRELSGCDAVSRSFLP